jgi:small-conductance mechanosensitive channel
MSPSISSSLVFWGVSLIVGFPLLVILLGETIDRLERRHSPLAAPLRLLRTFVLPVLAFELLLRRLFGFSAALPSVRATDTVLLIAIVATVLSAINVILIQQAGAAAVWARIPTIVFQLARFAIVALAIAVALSGIWDVNLSGAVTALGIGSLVFALALQEPLSNLFSGVLLIFDRPFNVGDWLRSGDIVGEVIEINWRAVRLRTKDNDLVVIPNGQLGKGIIHNYSQPTRLHAEKIEIRFSYDDLPNRVQRIIGEAAAATEGVAEQPAPDVRTLTYEDSAIVYQVKYYVADFGEVDRVRNALTTSLFYAAKREGLTIPLAARRIFHFDGAVAAEERRARRLADCVQTLSSLFHLDRQTIELLAASATVKSYGAGEAVITLGQAVPGVFVIVNGRARISAPAATGDSEEVAMLSRGELFGELMAAKGEGSSLAVTAVEDLEILLLDSATVMDLAATHAIFAREVEQVIDVQRKAAGRARDRRTRRSLGATIPS